MHLTVYQSGMKFHKCFLTSNLLWKNWSADNVGSSHESLRRSLRAFRCFENTGNSSQRFVKNMQHKFSWKFPKTSDASVRSCSRCEFDASLSRHSEKNGYQFPGGHFSLIYHVFYFIKDRKCYGIYVNIKNAREAEFRRKRKRTNCFPNLGRMQMPSDE